MGKNNSRKAKKGGTIVVYIRDDKIWTKVVAVEIERKKKLLPLLR